MASPSTSSPDHRGNTNNFKKSHFQQTVCLTDWWLVKAENEVQGRRLAVAGLTHRGKQAMRVFTSAPILKRYDAFTIETTDGICVILKGFINKALTLEHGFPSDVFNHFIFGFPLYWKEYDKKFVGKEPPSKDIVTDKPLAQLSTKLGSTKCSAMEGAQPHLDSHEKDFGSQGKFEAKTRRKSKRAKSVAVRLPQKYSASGLQKESYCGCTCVENHIALELPVNSLENEVKSLSHLSCDGSIKVPAVINKSTDYSQLNDSGGALFACHLYKKTEREADNLRKMDDEKTKTKSDWDMSSSEKISSHNEVRVMTRSIRNFRMKEMNNERSAGIVDCEKIRLNSISSIGSRKVKVQLVVDQETASINNWNSEVSGSYKTAYKIPETCNQDKGIRETKTRSNIRKAKNKAMDLPSTPAAPTKSHHCPAAEDNQRDIVITGKNSSPEAAKALDMVTKQKSVPVTKVRPSVTIIPETCKQDKGIGGIKTRSNTRKAKNKAMELPSTPAAPTKSHHSPAAKDNQRDSVITGKNSLPETAKALDMVTKQKSVPMTKVGPFVTIIPENCNQDKGIGEIKTRSNIRKAKNKATELPSTPAAPTKSHHSPAAIEYQRDTVITEKNSLPEKAKALDMVTKQKSMPVSKETPERDKEKGWSASPRSGSFNKSRSGRLLLPTLEFWRNQRAIYNEDRTITGIEDP